MVYFDLDLVLCGIDEAGIYKLGLPVIKRNLNKEVGFIYLPMVPGVLREEMHASDSEENKVPLRDILSEDESVAIKIRSSDPLQKSIKEFVLPILTLTPRKSQFDSVEELINAVIYHIKKEVSCNE